MTDLLALAQAHVDPALLASLERTGAPLAADGPDGAHVVPARLAEAMRYAVTSPGKRLRPALVIGGAHAIGAPLDDVLAAACAVEMVHAYSLVHDDLPALDDDDTRRGIPACHKRFDEATALLAGDALLTEALALLADPRPFAGGRAVDAERRAAAVTELARAIGAAGMVGGQYDDVTLEATRAQLYTIHRRKTGRLIAASVALGAIVGGGDDEDVGTLRAFGADIGLAFQLVDDILDADGVVPHVGQDAARQEAVELTVRAVERLAHFGDRGAPLARVAEQMAERIR